MDGSRKKKSKELSKEIKLKKKIENMNKNTEK